MSDQYVTHWLSAKYQELTKKQTVKVKIGSRTVQKKKSMFSSEMVDVEEDILEERETWVGTGKFSDRRIDMGDLARRIQETCNSYWKDGYEISQKFETIEGNYNYEAKSGGSVGNAWGWGYGYGYSVTDGVILLFKRRAP